ncbi:MAG: hypothetical protein CVV64_19730 [Candidatus Wallbacteria bacterium HGW-Wallbacteria-1]|uniref:RHS repeat-associated core domain-containing protein n=1 Tax=Candidatus Wallbacteria bacterium HGW-Wallbacteria-1 TaxID=2013854 RepID=A0A2N1PIU3_9BACT|nr:MAG: hypothetical protein CVV64_19730 [Candidatus Wallbacteria bacterium HGW-Wallbacteria-1]
MHLKRPNRLQRWTSKDPIGFNGGNNLYRYADNNPLRYTDPTGLFIAETLAVLTVKEILIGTGLFGGAVYFNTPEGKKTLTDFVQKLQSGAAWTKEKIQDAFNSVTCELLPDAAAEQIYLASANDSGSGNSGDDSGSNNTGDPNDPKDPRQKVIEALDQIFKNHRFTREEISTAVDRITKFIQQYEMHDPRVAAIIRQVIEEILGRRN